MFCMHITHNSWSKYTNIPLNIEFALNETLKIYIVHRHKLKSIYGTLALVEEL